MNQRTLEGQLQTVFCPASLAGEQNTCRTHDLHRRPNTAASSDVHNNGCKLPEEKIILPFVPQKVQTCRKDWPWLEATGCNYVWALYSSINVRAHTNHSTCFAVVPTPSERKVLLAEHAGLYILETHEYRSSGTQSVNHTTALQANHSMPKKNMMTKDKSVQKETRTHNPKSDSYGKVRQNLGQQKERKIGWQAFSSLLSSTYDLCAFFLSVNVLLFTRRKWGKLTIPCAVTLVSSRDFLFPEIFTTAQLWACGNDIRKKAYRYAFKANRISPFSNHSCFLWICNKQSLKKVIRQKQFFSPIFFSNILKKKK